MRSQLDVRLGAQEPVILHTPPGVASLAAAEEAIELADAYGICDGNPLAESQKITLRAALGERADGSWAASKVADFGPRQGTGKSDKINARELAGLVLFGERLIIHTAHEFATANESFLRLVSIFENYDDLRKRVARIRYANGEQGIEFLSGQRLKYRARTGGAGRGFAKADLVVYDEAQHLLREHVAASGPAKLANPNSQTWYAGSGGLATSKVAWGLRSAAILGDAGRLAYTEMTAETIEVIDGRIVTHAPDPEDRDTWYRAIPGLGRWITEEGVDDLRDELKELFPRECLCVWEPEPTDGERVLPEVDWRLCANPNAETTATPRHAIEVDQDGYAAAIGASDGVLAKVLEWHKGSKWVVPKLRELGISKVWLDPNGPAGALITDLEATEDADGNEVDPIEWEAVSPRQHAQACGSLFLAVTEDHSFLHTDQPVLNIAVEQATKRLYGDAWAWDRRRPNVSVSPLVVVTIARWAALQAVEATAEPGFFDLADFLEEDDTW